uniref:Integrase, catalytic region, zinc finger, CCHC-type, peptidase aspartic, catalytic n=1 Tax=Tanacetum cinerariifolium TaxID=118510 RepID=A0A6L2JFP8_TANCI|nr:hypothetical protein [Tanacetum cinerariifolium]
MGTTYSTVLQGNENGHHILSYIDEGPFKMGTCRDAVGATPEGAAILGPERPRTYDDLDDNDKARFNADVQATNIVLQGLPKDIYTLINHNIKAKAIWDNVKMLLEGSEMTMTNIQLNSKFVNNMTPEWDRFVTSVKLNKSLKETNHEQLYAYLKQYEKHATQDRIIIERLSPPSNVPLVFVSSVEPQVQSSYTPHQSSVVQSNQYPSPSAPLQSPYVQPTQYLQFADNSQLDTRYTPTKEMIEIKQQFRMGKSLFKQFMGDRIRIKGTMLRELVQHPMREYRTELGMQIRVKQNKSSVTIAVVLDEEELLFLDGDHANTFDADVDEKPVRDMAQNDDNIFQADECDAFGSDINDGPTAQTIFMANLSSAGPAHQQAGPFHASTLSEVQNLDNDVDHVNVNHKEHEIYNEVQQPIVVDSNTVEMGYQNSYYLNKARKAQPALYDGHEILKTNHVPAIVPTSEEDLELADISREKMIKKVKDPESLVKEVRAMKAVFENMEGEADQKAIDKKCDAIEMKNLLITNKNLIANCISQEVFYTVTDSVLTASRFHELNVAYDVEKSHAVKLEAENSKLLEKIQNDDHDSIVKHFSKLEIDHLNLQLKYQRLKENIGNSKSKTSKDAPEFFAFLN